MKTFSVFLLVMLVYNLAEGRTVSKCELKDQLVEAINNLPVQLNGQSADDFVATLVCHAGLVSGLRTSTVKEVISGEQEGHSRDRRNAHKSPLLIQPSSPNQPQHILPAEPNPSGQPSSNYQSKPSGQPSSNYQSKPSGQPSSNYQSKPSGQPSSNYQSKPSGLPSSNSEPKLSGQPSSNFEPKPSGQPSSNYQSKPSGQPSSNSEPKPPGQPPANRPRTQRSLHFEPKPSSTPSSHSRVNPSGQPTSHFEPKPSGQPPAFHPRALRSPQDSNTSAIGMLYGIFQLSNHLACSDGTIASPNVCGLDCSKLVDDNITDDINCMLKVTSFGKRPSPEEVCRNVQAFAYFAVCTSS